MHCTNWQNTSNHKCNDEGGSLILLNSSIKTAYECETLCIKNDPGVGCCHLSSADGCFWKSNATAETTTDDNNSFAVNCTYEPPGELSVQHLRLSF